MTGKNIRVLLVTAAVCYCDENALFYRYRLAKSCAVWQSKVTFETSKKMDGAIGAKLSADVEAIMLSEIGEEDYEHEKVDLFCDPSNFQICFELSI